MSQSGTTISPRRRLIKPQKQYVKSGSLGMKSSDARAIALFFELKGNKLNEKLYSNLVT